MDKKRTGFTISSVANMYEIHPQTLRAYERQGLLKPSRTEGNTRLYNQAALKRVELILNLTRELGVNLAGVEVILNMREKMEQMHFEVEALFEDLRTQLNMDEDSFQGRVKEALIRVPPLKLSRIVGDKTADPKVGE